MLHEKVRQIMEETNESIGAHILYTFDDEDIYLENAVKYIVSGLEQGYHVLIIESKRNIPKMREKLESLLTEEQLSKAHYVNNHDFYILNGNFHAPTILNYFSRFIGPLLDDKGSCLTWAHVEWGDDQEMSKVIAEFEKESDKRVCELGTISVCAYNSARISDDLKEELYKTHSDYFTDEDMIKDETNNKYEKYVNEEVQ